MSTIEIIPNDTAPSDAEKTQYNVFVNSGNEREFIGYVALNWMGYWMYYIDGESKDGWSNREELFKLIEDDPYVHA